MENFEDKVRTVTCQLSQGKCLAASAARAYFQGKWEKG